MFGALLFWTDMLSWHWTGQWRTLISSGPFYSRSNFKSYFYKAKLTSALLQFHTATRPVQHAWHCIQSFSWRCYLLYSMPPSSPWFVCLNPMLIIKALSLSHHPKPYIHQWFQHVLQILTSCLQLMSISPNLKDNTNLSEYTFPTINRILIAQ